MPYRLLRACGASVAERKPVVTICESGPRAAIAASVLAAAGVDARPVLHGGITDWERRGGQTVEFRRCGWLGRFGQSDRPRRRSASPRPSGRRRALSRAGLDPRPGLQRDGRTLPRRRLRSRRTTRRLGRGRRDRRRSRSAPRGSSCNSAVPPHIPRLGPGRSGSVQERTWRNTSAKPMSGARQRDPRGTPRLPRRARSRSPSSSFTCAASAHGGVQRLRVLRPGCPNSSASSASAIGTLAVAAGESDRGAAGVALRGQVVRRALLDLIEERIRPDGGRVPVAELVLPPRQGRRGTIGRSLSGRTARPRALPPATPSTASTSSPRDHRRAARLPIPRHISKTALAERAISIPSEISTRPLRVAERALARRRC